MPDQTQDIWNLGEFPAQLARMRDQVGFPWGRPFEKEGDQDPTFQRNKMVTIAAMPHLFLPTFKLELTPDDFENQLLRHLSTQDLHRNIW